MPGEKEVFTKEQLEAAIQKELNEKISKTEEALKQEFSEKIKEAVKEEKDKLYNTIEKEKKEKEAVAEELKKTAEEKKRLEAEKLELEEKFKALPTDEKLKELNQQIEITNTRFNQLLDEKDAKFAQEIRKRDLKNFTLEAIQKIGKPIIHELVMGNSEEEITQSIERAAAKYEEIAAQAKKQVEENFVINGKVPGQKESSVSKPAGSRRSIFTMSDAEFEAFKAEEFAKISGK